MSNDKYIESNIRALVLVNLLNSLRKRDNIIGKPRISSFFPTRLINSVKHEHSCKILDLINAIKHPVKKKMCRNKKLD